MIKNISFSKVSSRLFLGAGVIAIALLVMSVPSFVSADTLNRQLELGMTGTDVSALQTFLAKDSALYPQGLVTGYYGFLTKAAVSNFQERNGISAVGRVGPVTLPVLNLQINNGVASVGDVYAPVINSVGINAGDTYATFSWTTNDNARGKLYYSTWPIRADNTFDELGVSHISSILNGTLAPYDDVARSSQSVNVTGLTPNTTYYYMIQVFDWSNNMSMTLPASFHTTQ